MLLGVFMEYGNGQWSHFGGGCGVIGDGSEQRQPCPRGSAQPLSTQRGTLLQLKVLGKSLLRSQSSKEAELFVIHFGEAHLEHALLLLSLSLMDKHHIPRHYPTLGVHLDQNPRRQWPLPSCPGRGALPCLRHRAGHSFAPGEAGATRCLWPSLRQSLSGTVPGPRPALLLPHTILNWQSWNSRSGNRNSAAMNTCLTALAASLCSSIGCVLPVPLLLFVTVEVGNGELQVPA